MDANILHFVGFLLYVFVLFICAGMLAWLATHRIEQKYKQYGVVLTLLILFPALIPNVMWDSWQIHLLFPLVYLFLVRASQWEIFSNFYLSARLHYNNPAIALGVFFVYAFASTAWAYFPLQSFMMISFQFVSIGFTYLAFTRIQHTRAETFANDGELARLCLVIGIGGFVLLALSSDIVPKIYSVTISLFEEKIKELSTNLTIAKYFELLTRLFLYRTFFDSGFSFFAVLAFPLAMLMPNRKASLFLLCGILLVILLISESQAAMLGLFCGICIVFFWPKIPRWAQQITPWVMLGGITLLPFFALLLTSELFSLAFVKESYFFVNSLEPRLWIYENTILLDIWMCPWFGCGINIVNLDQWNNVSIFSMFFAASSYTHPHSHTLTLLIELGITGLLLFLWVCACILHAIQTLNEQYRHYALGAFFSSLCLTAFTQHLWGIVIIIWCSAFLVFALFGRSYPSSDQ